MTGLEFSSGRLLGDAAGFSSDSLAALDEEHQQLLAELEKVSILLRAWELWEGGRAVSVIVAGARGSGKTSILNCANTGVFSDLPTFNLGRPGRPNQM